MRIGATIGRDSEIAVTPRGFVTDIPDPEQTKEDADLNGQKFLKGMRAGHLMMVTEINAAGITAKNYDYCPQIPTGDDVPEGISINDVENNRPINDAKTVRQRGRMLLMAGAPVAAGNLLMAEATGGRTIPAPKPPPAGAFVYGRALQAAPGADVLFEAQVDFFFNWVPNVPAP